MNPAAARAATRRGSSITILRPSSQGASSKASGTCVVLPAPGGASSTSRGCAASDARICGSSSAMGNVEGLTAQGYWFASAVLWERRESRLSARFLVATYVAPTARRNTFLHLVDFLHATDRHRRQPHPRQL